MHLIWQQRLSVNLHGQTPLKLLEDWLGLWIKSVLKRKSAKLTDKSENFTEKSENFTEKSENFTEKSVNSTKKCNFYRLKWKKC